jgi:hypothetical protein
MGAADESAGGQTIMNKAPQRVIRAIRQTWFIRGTIPHFPGGGSNKNTMDKRPGLG